MRQRHRLDAVVACGAISCSTGAVRNYRMDLVNGLMTVLTPEYLGYSFAGCLLGTLVGVLPGVGAASAVAILFPFVAILPPAGMIITMAAIYYGAQYGGSTTAILVNVPGEV